MFRRDFLFGLAALSLIPASGCALLQRESELDAQFNELDSLFNEIPNPQRSTVQAIAADLRTKSSQLMNVHREFLVKFNTQSVDRRVKPDALRKTTVLYNEQRIAVRNQLLYLQDDLYRALPESTRASASDILNQKNHQLMSQQWRES